MFRILIIVGLMLTLAILTSDTAQANGLGPLIFDFDDPKNTNAVALTVEAPWEPTVGFADGVSGTANFDPESPRATTGKITVAVNSIRFPNPGYTETVKNYALEGEKYPTLTCELKKIVGGKMLKQGVYEGTVEVDFTCRGITKVLTIPLTVSYLPGVAKKRSPDIEGDLLNVRSRFAIRRADFNIAKGVSPELIGEEVEVRVSIVGICRRTPEPPKPATNAAPKEITLTHDGKSASLAERMAFHKIPGLSVAVIKDFQVSWIGHYGNAATDRPVDDKTLYSVGTMSQPLVALATLRAVDRGAISLDANINDYLKEWKVPDSPLMDAKRGVTVRDLLTHRSGFTYHKYMGYSPTGTIPSLLAVLKGESPAVTPPTRVASAPGSQFALNAENYTVLQQVATDLSNASFDSVMRDLILDPLKMSDSLFAPVPPPDRVRQAAIGHSDRGTPLPGGWRVYPEVAASGFWTTPQDYSRFLCETLKTVAGRSNDLLKPEMAHLLVEPIVQKGEDGQAIGFGLTKHKQIPYIFKGGNTVGYYCYLEADPEKGNAVIVFINRNLCWQFANEVRDAVARREGFRGF